MPGIFRLMYFRSVLSLYIYLYSEVSSEPMLYVEYNLKRMYMLVTSVKRVEHCIAFDWMCNF